MKYVVCIPAYGRDYKTPAAVRADWDANKDFYMVGVGGGAYINKSDANKYGVTVQLRFSRREKLIVIEPESDNA